MSELIHLQGVSKTFTTGEKTFKALQEVHLKVEKGEYLTIIGKSGSGKSTLLNVLTGIDYPSSGTVTVNGTELNTLNESQLATWRGKNIGIIFQFFQLIPTLTILENLLLAMEFVAQIPKNQRTQRAMSLLERVGIQEHAHKMPSALSGGEQQRAAIARSLVNAPQLLIADEPTGNLDSQTSETIQTLFKDLAEAGTTIILVTHDQEISTKANRIITLSDGKIISDTRAQAES